MHVVIAGRWSTGHNQWVRWLVGSLAVHALVVLLLVRSHAAWYQATSVHPVVVAPDPEPMVVPEPEPMVIEMIAMGGGGGGRIAATRSASSSGRYATQLHVATERSPWEELEITTERPQDSNGNRNGNGNGNGNSNGNGNGNSNRNGNGNGNGIGFGNGGGVRVVRDVPAPPMPEVAPASKARPAKLIWPNRDVEVEDDSYLFTARVTVDDAGDVVGALMLTSRQGSRADRAADAIWSFRYAPALDDAGRPVRSTFEQSFQVR